MIFHLPICERKHIESPAETPFVTQRLPNMPCKTLQCPATGGAPGSQPSGRFCLDSVSNGLRSRAQNVISLFLWCLRMPMLPVFMKWHHVFRRKKKTNILNMFTENCLLYIHIIIYLFYSQCALHNQDIGFVAFCPCSHPKLLQPFCKDIYRRWTVTVSFSAVSNGLLVASTK